MIITHKYLPINYYFIRKGTFVLYIGTYSIWLNRIDSLLFYNLFNIFNFKLVFIIFLTLLIDSNFKIKHLVIKISLCDLSIAMWYN